MAQIDFRDFSQPLLQIVSFEAKWDATSFAYHYEDMVYRIAEMIQDGT